MFFRFHVPQFLDADAVGLRLGAVPEVITGHDLGAQRSANPFGEEGVFGVQLDPRLVVGAGSARLVQAHVAGGDSLDGPAGVVKNLGGGEAGIDFDAQVLGLGRQPAAEVAEAESIAALVAHHRWQQEMGNRHLACG